MSTDSIPDMHLSYKFPDPTDPTHFQANSHHPSTTHQTPSLPTPASSRLSPPPSAVSISQINSDHNQLESDWSILSLKNQSSRSKHNQIPPAYPDHPIVTPDPHHHHLLQLALLSDHSSKCQKWLENLTSTSEFSCQVSEQLSPSSPDRVNDLSASEPRLEVNKVASPENNVTNVKSSIGSGSPPLECFLDPTMDLSSSYLEPEQLAKPRSISPPLPLQTNPAPKKPTDSQVITPPSKSDQLSHSQAGNHPKDVPSSHGSSPHVPPDSHGSLWSNRWSLLIFNPVWPLSLAFFMYSKRPQQVFHPVSEPIELDFSDHLASSEVSEELDTQMSEDLIDVNSKPVPKELPSIETHDEELVYEDPISSSSSLPNPELHHKPEKLDHHIFSEAQLAPEIAAEKAPQLLDFEPLRSTRDPELETTRLDHHPDVISTRPDHVEDAAKVVENFEYESLLTTHQLDESPQTTPSLSSPIVILLILVVLGVMKKMFISNNKKGAPPSEEREQEMTASEIMSKIEEKAPVDIDMMQEIRISHEELGKLIKSLERRIRVSKDISQVELNLLAWLKKQRKGYSAHPPPAVDLFKKPMLVKVEQPTPGGLTDDNTKPKKRVTRGKKVIQVPIVKKEDEVEEEDEREDADGNVSDRTIQPDHPIVYCSNTKSFKNNTLHHPSSSSSLLPKRKSLPVSGVGASNKLDPTFSRVIPTTQSLTSSPSVVPPRRTSNRLKKNPS